MENKQQQGLEGRESAEVWRLFRKNNQKAVLINNGKATFGVIKDVKMIRSPARVLVTMQTLTGKASTFDALSKLETEEFKLISDGVYNMATKPSEDDEKKLDDVRLRGIRRNSIVETLILTGRYQGIWIRAKVIRVEYETMDLSVLLPEKWKVAGTALAVPNQFIRSIDGESLENYTIPIEFTLDGSVMYASCNDHMRVRDLKETINKERKFPLNQIYFIHEGRWLDSSDRIPNNIVFCIIHRGGKLTKELIDLAAAFKRKSSNSASKGGSKTSATRGKSDRRMGPESKSSGYSSTRMRLNPEEKAVR